MDRNKIKTLSNQSKCLYVIKELDGTNFTKIMNITGISRNTVSKYLRILLEGEYIKKHLVLDDNGIERVGYAITEQGNQLLNVEFTEEMKQNWLVTIRDRDKVIELMRTKNLIQQTPYQDEKRTLGLVEDAFFNLLNTISDIIGTGGEELGDLNVIIARIGNYTSKFGEDFFKLPFDVFMYLAIVYINFNSLENPQYNISVNNFVEIYGKYVEKFHFKSRVEKLEIHRKQAQKILKDEVVINQLEILFERQENLMKIPNNNDIQQYTKILDETKNRIIKQLPYSSSLPQDSIKKFLEKYRVKYHNYFVSKEKIKAKLNDAIEKIVKGNYGLNSFTANYDLYFFHNEDSVGNFLTQRISDALNEEWINKKWFGIEEGISLEDIAKNIVSEMSVMHMIWEDVQRTFYDVVLAKIYKKASELELRNSKELITPVDLSQMKGFCPNCGVRILLESETCDYCKTNLNDVQLVYDIRKAQKISSKFKEKKNKQTKGSWAIVRVCNHCGTKVGRTWTRCPKCKRKLNPT